MLGSQVDCDAVENAGGRAAEPCSEKLHFEIENRDKDPLHIHEKEARRREICDSNENTIFQ